MKTEINKTSFGSISINGSIIDHDVIVRLSGKVKKRKKALSKEVTGTSHSMSRQEAEYIYEEDCETLIVGTGQYGVMKLSKEALEFFQEQNCRVIQEKTPSAIKTFNNAADPKIGVFHVTC